MSRQSINEGFEGTKRSVDSSQSNHDIARTTVNATSSQKSHRSARAARLGSRASANRARVREVIDMSGRSGANGLDGERIPLSQSPPANGSVKSRSRSRSASDCLKGADGVAGAAGGNGTSSHSFD